MAFCKNCGTEMKEGTVFCPNCGQGLNAQPQQPVETQQTYQTYTAPQQQPAANDSGSFGWAVLGFCIPLVGLILFLVWKDNKPVSAKKAGIGALVSVGISIVLSIISGIFGGMMMY